MGVWGLPQLWRPYFGCFARSPDLTANSPQSQCVSSGTVAGGVEFHLVVNYGSVQGQGAIINVTCNYIDILEQTDVHEPQHFRLDNPQGTTYTPDQISTVCSSPPTGYQNYIVFSTPPFWGFACHNTSYLVKASYSYTKVTGPPPTYQRIGPIEVSITVNFNNLTVEAEPEYLINNPGGDNHNTTITFQLQSAQKKLCSATISIYTSTQQLVKQETLNNLLCPGTYTYTWDGKMTQQYPQGSSIAPRGVYLYDIEVVGACPYDTDTRCSKALKITQTKFEIEEIEVGYVLEDTAGKSAYQGKVTVFNKNLQNLAEIEDGTITNLPGTSNPIWNEATLNIEFPDEGPYTFLVSAIDDHRELDKAHRRKTALPKNQRRVLPIHTILLDAGHGGSDPGTLGSYYWDPESRHNVNRHNREEAELNEDVRQALEAILQWHNNPKNRPSYILRYEEVPRSAWRARVRWAYNRTRNTDRNPVKLLISIHHNGFWTYDKDSKWYYPYSRSDNHGMYHTNNYRREHGSDCNFYRFEKFDLDLVDSITNTLRQCMRESDYQLTLPVDERLIGHRFRDPRNPIPGDPNEVTDSIRETERAYSLSYGDNRYVWDPETQSGAGIVVRPCCSATLLELATLTNYDDEDYRMLEGADHLLASAIYWGIRGFISMHPTVLRWENMRYQE